MGKPYSKDLRSRFVALLDVGASASGAGKQLLVARSTATRWGQIWTAEKRCGGDRRSAELEEHTSGAPADRINDAGGGLWPNHVPDHRQRSTADRWSVHGTVGPVGHRRVARVPHRDAARHRPDPSGHHHGREHGNRHDHPTRRSEPLRHGGRGAHVDVKAALPFVSILFIFLILITYVPIITTWLPTRMMGPEIVDIR